MEKLRVMVCDDLDYICKAYKDYIDLTDDMVCVGMSFSGEDCIKKVMEVKPDILLLDIQMEEKETGIEIIEQIHGACPKTGIIMLSSHGESKYIFLSILRGAIGFVIKNPDGNVVLNEVRKIYHNKGVRGDSEITEKFEDESRRVYQSNQSMLFLMNKMVRLSIGEYEVLRDVYSGMSYSEIADKRFVDESSVRKMISRILKKFEEKSMKKLVAELREVQIFGI